MLADVDTGDARAVAPRVDFAVDAGIPPWQRFGLVVVGFRGGGAERAYGAVKSGPELGRHVIDAIDDRSGAGIGAACLRPLLPDGAPVPSETQCVWPKVTASMYFRVVSPLDCVSKIKILRT